MKTDRGWAALAQGDYGVCLRFNRYSERRWICALFRGVSWLGNGCIWYATILAMPLLYGMSGLRTSVLLAATSLAGLWVYKAIKVQFRRPRPYHRYPDIRAAAAALDEFSFPSGHTLHAVAFVVVFCYLSSPLLVIFVPFAVLTALSRVVLGLHYPSDVVFGAALGALVANILIQLAVHAGLLI